MHSPLRLSVIPMYGDRYSNALRFYQGLEGKKKTDEITHLLLNGGILRVPEHAMPAFRVSCGDDLTYGLMQPITENHTVNFPFYVDVDLSLPLETLSEECVAKIARTMNFQIQLFFEDRHEPFRCVVCTKDYSRVDRTSQSDGNYKHGIHFHWPELIVNIDQAYEIRASIVAGLEFDNWSGLLSGTAREASGEASGTKAGKSTDRGYTVDWDEVVDASVYKGGLRMIGAPKAKKCSTCKGTVKKDPETKMPLLCEECHNQNNCHILDKAVYRIDKVFVGQNVDDALLADILNNKQRMFRETSVRAPSTASLTAGYRKYLGCPNVSAPVRKRKGVPVSSEDDRRVEKRYKQQAEVTDPKVLKVVRELLIRQSPIYSKCKMTVRTDGKSYRVCLSGEGSSFCFNKNGDHNSNHVYMVIQVGYGGQRYESRMRCWCNKKTVENRTAGIPCSEYWGRVVHVKPAQCDVLFPMQSKDPKAMLRNLKKEADEYMAMRKRERESYASGS